MANHVSQNVTNLWASLLLQWTMRAKMLTNHAWTWLCLSLMILGLTTIPGALNNNHYQYHLLLYFHDHHDDSAFVDVVMMKVFTVE